MFGLPIFVVTVFLHLVFPQLTNGFLSCPESVGYKVVEQDGADGRFHIAGDFLLTNQTMPQQGEGSNITVIFTLKSAFDNSSFACFGQLISSARIPTGSLTGKCTTKEQNPAIGETQTTFTYGVEEVSGNSGFPFTISQNLQCIWNNTTRP
jgi:hypothetical protein